MTLLNNLAQTIDKHFLLGVDVALILATISIITSFLHLWHVV